uniref:Uncharacterized protein n=1 Tax=Pseudomonas phage HRDY3 TaxID=3236930 RepID=A0AB39CE64_9VIRU
MSRNQSTALMRPLTVTEALKRDDVPLYVMNRTKPAGNINLTVKGDDETLQSIVIPKTFVPIDMTLFAPRKNLLLNKHFRQLCQLGEIAIAHPDDAEAAIQASPKAKQEIQRVLQMNASDKESNVPEMLEMRTDIAPPVSPQAPVQNEESYNPTPFVAGIVNRALNEGEDMADLMDDISMRRDELNFDDLNYIANNVEDVTLKQFIADLL